jgi:hypothetical protein
VKQVSSCDSVIHTPTTDFVVEISCPVDQVQPSGFRVNNIGANSFTVSKSTVTFHFNTSPVVPGLNTIHILNDAITCCIRPVNEFTCTFTYVADTPTPTPTATPTATATPTPPQACRVSFVSYCGEILPTPPTDFNVSIDCPIDLVAAAGFTVNNIPADSAYHNVADITFHFNSSPAVPGLNTIHLYPWAVDCCHTHVDEFTCTFTSPRAAPRPRPRPTPRSRP